VRFAAAAPGGQEELMPRLLRTIRDPIEGRARRRTFRRLSPHLASAAGVCVGILLLTYSDAAAQDSRSVLSGTVSTASGEPLASAQIIIVGTQIHGLTQQNGSFRIVGIPAGNQTVRVQHLGYRVAEATITLPAGETTNIAVRLEHEPIAVDGVDVEVRAGLTPQMQGFYDRRSRGMGYFLTRSEIESMQVRQFTDVLRRVPGLQIGSVQGPMGASQVAQIGRTTGFMGQRSCVAQYYMNGVPFSVAQDIGINTYVRPEDIAGIEIYSGTSRIPPQFTTSQQASRCGVIVIWTHGGAARS
jgi:hypothetical protein